jgi:CBS domain-containing protein
MEPLCSIATLEVATAGADDIVAAAARRMCDLGVGTLVVVDATDRPLGIVTDRDVMVRCIAAGRDPGRTRLAEVMSNPVAWIHADAGVEAALEEMVRLRVRRLAVVDEHERLVGVLALDDVLCRAHEAASPLGRAIRATM